MCDATRRYWITYNGEIYNYLEIREELRSLGHDFTTATDTEVIIAAYTQWGTACLEKFNGMWAFAIYDSIEQNLFLSRDRYGIKPLYYWIDQNGAFHFGSEIKQFTSVEGWKAILNGARAHDYLYYSLTDHTDETLFQGVYRLLPGHFMTGNVNDLLQAAKTGKIHQQKWYKPVQSRFDGDFATAVCEFQKRFVDAVRLHLRSDVPVGSALSGGIDSSSIVTTVHKILSENGSTSLQNTFSSCSTDERYDERPWMDIVVEATDVNAHFVYPNGFDVFSITDLMVWNMDEPYDSQSAFLGFHVFREAKKHGVKVLLNGQGADEYLSCYSELKNLRQWQLIKNGRLFKLWREVDNPWDIVALIKSRLYSKLPSGVKLLIGRRSIRRRHLDQLINHELLVSDKRHPYDINSYTRTDHTAISSYQIFHDPLQRYLRWEDRNSMAHSVEARVPFLDYRLVEFTSSLPLGYLDAPGIRKRILVEAMIGLLPEKVRLRKDKKGFITPERRWFLEDLREQFMAFFEDHVQYAKGVIDPEKSIEYLTLMQDGKVPFDTVYWRIMLFCVWMKKFDVDIS